MRSSKQIRSVEKVGGGGSNLYDKILGNAFDDDDDDDDDDDVDVVSSF